MHLKLLYLAVGEGTLRRAAGEEAAAPETNTAESDAASGDEAGVRADSDVAASAAAAALPAGEDSL